MRRPGHSTVRGYERLNGRTVVSQAMTSAADQVYVGTLTYVPWYMNPWLRKRVGMSVLPVTKTGTAGAIYSTNDWVDNWPRNLLCPEAAVARRTVELRRANQEIQRFAYIVSHDLRSPLVNVLGFTAELDAARKVIREFLEKTFERHPALKDESAWLAVDEDVPEALGFIRTSTEKMDRLINSILELSRQGRRPLKPEPLDLTEVTENVVATLHQRAQDAGATITVDEGMPTLDSDRIAVEQMLSNLIENAIKYLSPNRPGEIAIGGRRNGPMIEIDVTDNGRGISPADHRRIFELFRRSGAQDRPGEGIGLANVRALAYRLGGTVDVKSELDAGSRFRLSLPAKFSPTEPSDD